MRQLKQHLGLTIAGVYRSPLNKTRPMPPPGVRPQLASPASLQPYLDKPEYELSPAFVAAAFAREDLCVCTYVNNELAAYGWVAYCMAPHLDGIYVRFARGQRYNYKNLTLPKFRGQHIRGSYGVLDERDQAEGVTHSIAFIETHNFASIRAEHRNRGRLVGLAGYFDLLGKRRFFASSGAKQHGFAFYQPATATGTSSS